jgi:hypothetical protein
MYGGNLPSEPYNMSLFEFVTVMISMILAMCLGQLLKSASYLAKTDREIVSYRPYSLWVVSIFLAVVNQWWSLWDLRGIDWNYVSFVYMLIAPTLVTFAVGLLAPSRGAAGPIDLEKHFSKIRGLFSKVLACYTLVMWFDGPFFAGQAPLGAVGLMHPPIIAAFLVPSFTNGVRANLLAASVVIVAMLAVMTARYSFA